MPQISPQILRKAAAKSAILGRENLKEIPRNPGGTDYKRLNASGRGLWWDNVIQLLANALSYPNIVM